MSYDFCTMTSTLRPSLTSLLPTLTIPQLKSLLTKVGANTGGTKPALISRLSQDLRAPKLPPQSARILSIDMGIRNLAYCVCDVAPPQHPAPATAGTESAPPTPPDPPALRVSKWERLALDRAFPGPTATLSSSDASDPFHPRALSELAYRLVAALLRHRPTTVLIERQRFRSGGGAAVLEWTVRVNMLESMLWAVLRTLGLERMRGACGDLALDAGAGEVERFGESEGKGFPVVFDVSPARVGAYWVGAKEGLGEGEDEVRKKRSPRENKKEKIAVVTEWLERDQALARTSPIGGHDHVGLSFSGDASHARDAFLAKLARGSKTNGKSPKAKAKAKAKAKDKSAVGSAAEYAQQCADAANAPASGTAAARAEDGVSKLDDLADCLLQAAAWTRWEANRRQIRRMSDEELLATARNGRG